MSSSLFQPISQRGIPGKRFVSVALAVASIVSLVSAQNENLELDYMPPQDAAHVESMQPEAVNIGGGVRFLELESGEGEMIGNGDWVEAIYTGTLLDGTVFNRKSGRFHTFKFTVGAEPREIIRGWEIAMPYMQNGGRYWVAIPSQFAYRDKGRRGQVPPFTTVVFEIEILDVAHTDG